MPPFVVSEFIEDHERLAPRVLLTTLVLLLLYLIADEFLYRHSLASHGRRYDYVLCTPIPLFLEVLDDAVTTSRIAGESIVFGICRCISERLPTANCQATPEAGNHQNALMVYLAGHAHHHG